MLKLWIARRSFDKADNIHSVGTKEVKKSKNGTSKRAKVE